MNEGNNSPGPGGQPPEKDNRADGQVANTKGGFPQNDELEQAATIQNSSSEGGNVFQWTAPEFVAHDKNPIWYAEIMGTSLIIAGIFYLITRDILSAVMLVIVALFLCIYSAKKPKQVGYRLDSRGFDIGPKHYSYEEFRYFTAAPEGRYITLTFIPLKRFSLPAGMCYNGPDAEKIINSVSQKLPFEQHKLDVIESFMQIIRF